MTKEWTASPKHVYPGDLVRVTLTDVHGITTKLAECAIKTEIKFNTIAIEELPNRLNVSLF